jgi:hypothetical protein
VESVSKRARRKGSDQKTVIELLAPSRRDAYIYIYAGRGNFRAARSVAVRALRDTLGDYRKSPWNGVYMSRPEMIHVTGNPDAEARYEIELTDTEASAFLENVRKIAKSEGWVNGNAGVHLYID